GQRGRRVVLRSRVVLSISLLNTRVSRAMARACAQSGRRGEATERGGAAFHGEGTLLATTSKSARRKGRAVTIHEVAAAAEVSPMTVSRVINGNANVRPETREQALRAVRELGYPPNLARPSLAAAPGPRLPA